MIESGINSVRASLKITYEGPDGCILLRKLQELFYRRLSRASGPGDANIPCLRRDAVGGFNISFVFTDEYRPAGVESFLREIIPIWRQLSKQLRLQQLIAHRRAGISLFEKMVKAMPVRSVEKYTMNQQEDSANESAIKLDTSEINSDATEYEDLGCLEEVEAIIEADREDNQFVHPTSN
jgi:hypothetical protein